MKIYNIEDSVYCLVKSENKKYIRYNIEDDSFFVTNAHDYEESELTTKIPTELRDTIFWVLFHAYGNAFYHNEQNAETFDVFIEVLS